MFSAIRLAAWPESFLECISLTAGWLQGPTKSNFSAGKRFRWAYTFFPGSIPPNCRATIVSNVSIMHAILSYSIAAVFGTLKTVPVCANLKPAPVTISTTACGMNS